MKRSDIEATILLRNNTPLDIFYGLTPNEMDHLMYDTFEERSPIQFHPDISDATLDKIPFFRLAEAFVKVVQREKRMKLTPSGALQRKVLLELYSHGFATEWYIENDYFKVWQEHHWPQIGSARVTANMAGLVKLSKGKIVITAQGTMLLKAENRVELFKAIFRSYCLEFNWGFNDYYINYPVGQFGFGYSMYLMDRFGDKLLPSEFYSSAYLKAIPDLIDHFADEVYTSAESQFHDCYTLRTFERFLDWFGLVQIEKNPDGRTKPDFKLMRSALFDQIFVID